MDLILASTSIHRKNQLEDFGLRPRCLKPEVDEERLKGENPDLHPPELALLLAKAKAHSLCAAHPQAVIVAGDQILSLDGKIFGKPHDFETAHAHLRELSGKTHELFSAMAVSYRGEVRSHLNVARIEMRPLSDIQIESYLHFDTPFDCAGSYKIEKSGRALFKSIETDDESGVTGLPLIALTEILLKIKFPLPFWSYK